MTFLTILGVTEILCSFKLVLEGKTGKEIPESSLKGSLEGLPTKNKEAPSHYEVRLALLDTNPVFKCLGEDLLLKVWDWYKPSSKQIYRYTDFGQTNLGVLQFNLELKLAYNPRQNKCDNVKKSTNKPNQKPRNQKWKE